MSQNISTSSISKARASRPHTGGLGVHTESPKRARKTKTQKRKLISYFHDDEKEKKRKRLAFLQGKAVPPAPSEPIIVDPPEDRPQPAESEPEDWVDDDDMADDTSRGPECNGPLLDASMDDSLVADSANLPPKRLVPDEAARELYQRWKALVPSLAKPLLTYLDSTIGKEWTRPAVSLKSECSRGGQCRTTKSIVTGLFFAGFMQHTVQSCQCESACHALLRSGLFPTSPSNPRQAISVELLDLFLALTARSSDAVTAMAAALNTTYRNRGFIIANSKGKKVKEPFRKGLGYALQWYDCVRIEIERLKENAIASKFMELFQVSSGMDPNDVPPPSSRPLKMQDSGPAECLGILQSRCAACFGGKNFGRPLEKGGDIHVAVDANFNHRHLRSAGTSPEFCTPQFFIAKEEVDAVGDRIEKQRPRKKPRKVEVPNEAIDSCQESHTAGTGSNVKTSMEKFDIGGLAALVCRHDIPLFIANVDTPGEQQKYAVALIEHLFLFLPRNATVVVLYDIACVVDRSVAQYELFAPGVAERLKLSTSVMHSYVHQWSCQLHYNPRFQVGLGLTDGENVERLWSRMRGLIPVCRTSGKNRRVWLIDRKLHVIAKELKEELGIWITRRLKKGVKFQKEEAQRVLSECRLQDAFLADQWADQKAAQTSSRSHAPARLKTHLGNILNIQTDINELEATIEKSLKLISKGSLPETCRSAISSLQSQLQSVEAKAQSLYAAIDLPKEFPSFQGVDLEFVRRLYLIREIKASVQRRATSTFWEFDKLDRATGGKDVALGTKMHQHVRSAMTKKAASLTTAIKRYNNECQALVALAKPEWNLHLPKPLPTSMVELKKCTTLMENVWVEPVQDESKQWVHNQDVRDGIRAMLRVRRCNEEQQRLAWESDNMLRWYKRQLQAIKAAIQEPANALLASQLQLELEDIVGLKGSWGTNLVTEDSYDVHSRGALQGPQIIWAPVTVVDDSADDSAELEELDTGISLLEIKSSWQDSSTAQTAEEICLDDLYAEQEGLENAGPPQPLECNLIWTELIGLTRYETLLKDFSLPPFKTQGLHTPRSFHTPAGKRLALFGEKELALLNDPRAWLNDDCVNGLITIVKWKLEQSDCALPSRIHQCAIFSTWALTLLQCNDEDMIWRQAKHTSFWTKDIWIFPTHQPLQQHWIAFIVLPRDQTVLVFDSLAQKRSCRRDLQLVMTYVQRVVEISNKRGQPLTIDASKTWTARPVIVEPVQSNSRDCGAWVIAFILSIFRGYHFPCLQESDIATLRNTLLQHVLAIPLS